MLSQAVATGASFLPARPAPRAFMEGFMDGLKREVDKTFNPRTRGAKIAGRAPGEERPTEVSPEKLAQWEADNGGNADAQYRPDFDLAAFTAQLEEQMRAEAAAKTAVELAEEKVAADLAARLAVRTFGHLLEHLDAAELGGHGPVTVVHLRASRRQLRRWLVRAPKKVVVKREFSQLLCHGLLDSVLTVAQVAAPQA